MKQLAWSRVSSTNIISGIFLFLICLTTTTIAVAQDKTSAPKIPPAGSFVLTVTDGRLSLEANDASVAKIFKEIGQKAGIQVDLQTASEEKMSIKLDRVPLEEAIKRLSENVALFYAKDSKEDYKIVKISVRLRGGESSGGLKVVNRPASIKVAQAPAPAETAKPEPFQFTFNP